MGVDMKPALSRSRHRSHLICFVCSCALPESASPSTPGLHQRCSLSRFSTSFCSPVSLRLSPPAPHPFVSLVCISVQPSPAFGSNVFALSMTRACVTVNAAINKTESCKQIYKSGKKDAHAVCSCVHTVLVTEVSSSIWSKRWICQGLYSAAY